jgi:hypothetical protein
MRDIFRLNINRRAKVAQCKENSVGKDQTRDKVMLGTLKGWTLERDNGRNRNVTRGTRTEPYRKMAGLEIAKRIVGSSDSIRPDKDWNLWRGRPLPKMEKETTSRGRTGNTEAPASSEDVRWMNVKSECDTTLDHGIIRDEQS